MSILITAAATAQAHQLKNILNTTGILLGDHNELPAFMVKNMGLIQLPKPTSASYQHEMLTLCLDRGIDTVYTLTEEEFTLLSESIQLFKEYNINIIDGQVNL